MTAIGRVVPAVTAHRTAAPRPTWRWKQWGLVIMLVGVLAACSGAEGTRAQPGQRPQTAGPDPGSIDGGEPTSLRPARGLLLGMPVYPGDFADPFVLVVDDRYYAYATNTVDANVPVLAAQGSPVARYLGDALPALPAWSTPGLVWAPAVFHGEDGYVLYYTTSVTAEGIQCISQAVAATPSGPFVDSSTEPFVCQRALGGSIDPSVVVDRDGTPWLLFKNDGNCCDLPTSLWVQQLSPDGRVLLGDATKLLDPAEHWEGELVEGPSMVVTPDRYLLFYSANAWDSPDYAVGYALCEAVTGPCRRPDGADAPWMGSTRFAAGPGGQEFFGALNRLWMIYHGWEPGEVGAQGAPRRLYLDIIEIDADTPRRVGAERSWAFVILVSVVALGAAGGLITWWARRRRSALGSHA